MVTNEPNFPTISPDWVSAMSVVSATIGTDRFPNALRKILSLCCGFDSMLVFRHEGTLPPRSMYQDLGELQAAISVDFYASGPYLLDPLYQAYQKGLAPGAYRLMDLAPEAFFRSEYYRTFYRKIRVVDEIGVLVPDGSNSWFSISLARLTGSQRFDAADTARLNALFELLSACVRRQWSPKGESIEIKQKASWEDKMQTFGNGVLSPREREVMQLVLLGHSTPSAAAVLGIAEGTVKVHRHHAYSKLGLSSQAELFSMASRHLTAAGSK